MTGVFPGRLFEIDTPVDGRFGRAVTISLLTASEPLRVIVLGPASLSRFVFVVTVDAVGAWGGGEPSLL